MSKGQTKKSGKKAAAKSTPKKSVNSAAKPVEKATKKTYSSMPMWQRVLIYAIIGAIVYFVIYLWFFKDAGSNGIY